MILDSSSNHHTANMRLLLITLACLATTWGLPHSKGKRDILPGDPRFEAGHDLIHHQHENVIEDIKSIGGYSYSTTPIPNEIYGSVGYQPGLAFSNEYLPPVVDKFSTPLPPSGGSGLIQVHHGLDSITDQSTVEVKKTITPAPLVIEKTEHIHDVVPTTSYGVPIDNKGLKTTLETAAHIRANIDATKIEIPTPAGKILEHAPLVQGVTGYAGAVHAAPAVTAVETKGLVGSGLFNGELSNLHTTYGGAYGIPGYDFYSHVPASFYSGLQPPFETLSAGFNGFGLNHGFYGSSALPLSSQIVKNYPTAYTFPQTLQVPHGLTRIAGHTEPLQTFHSLASAPAINTFSAVHSAHPVETLAQPIHHVQNLGTVESVHSVETVTAAPTIHHVEATTPVAPVHAVGNLGAIEAVRSVETFGPLHQVHAVKTLPQVHSVHPAETLGPVAQVHSVKTLAPLQTLHTVKSFTPVHSVHSVEGLVSAGPLHSVETVNHVEPLHAVKTLAPVQTVHSVKSVTPLPTVHTLKSFTPVPTVASVRSIAPVHPGHPIGVVKTTDASLVTPVHSVETVTAAHPVEINHGVDIIKTNTAPLIEKHVNIQRGPFEDLFQNFASLIPQFPSFPTFGISSTTLAPPVEVSTPGTHLVTETLQKGAVTVGTPISSPGHLQLINGVSSNGYGLQPTAFNGGYIY